MKNKWWLGITLVLLVPVVFHYDTLRSVLQNDIGHFMEQELGYQLLWITLPLSVFQSVMTVFPFMTIVIIHVLAFGLWEGLFYSWIGSSLGALACFVIGRHLLQGWSRKIWQKQQDQYEKWVRIFNLYGLWAVILLRSIPVMPSNLISLMAAFSPMSMKTYVLSTFIGNVSMVWMFGIFSDALMVPDESTASLLVYYMLFVLVLVLMFLYHYKTNRSSMIVRRSDRQDSTDR